MRAHLDKHHHNEYLELAAERGWRVQLASQRDIHIITIANTTQTPFSVDAETDDNVDSIVADDQVWVKQFSFDNS